MIRILIVDDETGILSALSRILHKIKGINEKGIVACESSKLALQIIEETAFDIIFCDIRLPDVSGEIIFRKIMEKFPASFVVMMTGYGEVKEAVQYMKDGAYDYITKPFENNQIEVLMKHMMKEIDLKSQIFELQHRLELFPYSKPFIYSSDSMIKIHEVIQNIRENDFSVLILGETGAGKEIVADAIHYSSIRKEGPFVKVNCAALVESLLESEIFGHEKGAFTGAVQTKKGKFELADNGTIFLDEIGDMDYHLQAKFLRVLQDGTFERVGGSKPIKVNCRIIAATSHDLEGEIKIGRFRNDLFYRLNVVNIKIPPLRERKEEIPELAIFFLDKLNKQYSKKVNSISPDFLDYLNEYDFPGNVRELQNIVTRAFASVIHDTITLEDIPEEIIYSTNSEKHKNTSSELDMKQAVEDVEKEIICRALKECQGKKNKASIMLNISRRMLYYKINKYNIPAD